MVQFLDSHGRKAVHGNGISGTAFVLAMEESCQCTVGGNHALTVVPCNADEGGYGEVAGVFIAWSGTEG